MHCEFLGGPLDGWKHYCPSAEVNEIWLVRCDKYEAFVEPRNADRWLYYGDSPLARYFLSEVGRMIFVNTVSHECRDAH